jgi:hypothetical protein
MSLLVPNSHLSLRYFHVLEGNAVLGRIKAIGKKFKRRVCTSKPEYDGKPFHDTEPAPLSVILTDRRHEQLRKVQLL